jgi:lipopolysaccharide biosynthesis glycosyltransferase
MVFVLFLFALSNEITNNLEVVKKKQAICTLFVFGYLNPNIQVSYLELLKHFTNSLRYSGYDQEIIVLVLTENDVNMLKKFTDITIHQVTEIPLASYLEPRYKKVLAKLHIWNLIEYDQLMFYDLDFIFLRNPATAFDDCGNSKFCACEDSHITTVPNYQMVPHGSYFNAGFMVIRPDKAVFNMLYKNRGMAENTYFPEQDLLNKMFKGQWKHLHNKYNIMHINQYTDITNAIAIHEKIYILKQLYILSNSIWDYTRLIPLLENERLILLQNKQVNNITIIEKIKKPNWIKINNKKKRNNDKRKKIANRINRSDIDRNDETVDIPNTNKDNNEMRHIDSNIIETNRLPSSELGKTKSVNKRNHKRNKNKNKSLPKISI